MYLKLNICITIIITATNRGLYRYHDIDVMKINATKTQRNFTIRNYKRIVRSREK